MSQFHPDDLANDILEQRCALLLGPEMLTVGSVPVTQVFQGYLQEHYGRFLQHTYEREGLFKFFEEKAKKRIQTEAIKSFYEQTQPDEAPLKKLLEIPFHLILQITPDTFLSDTALRHTVDHQFRYFCGGGRPVDSVDKPTNGAPLLYNLCGMRDRYDSMVLDYDDVFAFLKSAFGAPGLPENLRTALSECTTFLYLGFQMDKWYTQLVMRWVADSVRGADRFSNDYNFGNGGEDIEDFVRQHLEIVTTGKQHTELLNELYQKFETKGKLRTVSNPVSPNNLTVRRLVQHGDLEKALEVYCEITQNADDHNAAVMLKGEYQELKKARDQYFLSNEQFWERSRQIKYRLLSLLHENPGTL